MRIFKSVIVGLLALVIPVCALQWGYYSKFRSGMVGRDLASMEALADMQKDRMETFVRHSLDRLDLVTSRRIFRELLRDYLQKRDKDAQYQLDRSLSDARRSVPVFEVISVADMKGRVVTSTDNALVGTDVSATDQFKHGSKQNTIFLEFPDEGSGKDAHVLLSGPMVIDDRIVAVALLRIDPQELLDLLRGPENLSGSSWTLVQRVDAVRVALITPSTNGSTLVRRIVPEDGEPHVTEAMRGMEITLLDDHPSLHVHATRFVPDVGWVIMTSRDVSALEAGMRDFRHSILLLALLLAAYVVGASLYLGRLSTALAGRHSHPRH